MPNLARTVKIGLPDLITLLNYYQAAVNSHVGDLGNQTYEVTLGKIANRSSCLITPEELESLVYHAKQAIFEKLKPVNNDLRLKSYYKLMKRLDDDIPQLFKTLPSGEIVFVNFEDRKDDANG